MLWMLEVVVEISTDTPVEDLVREFPEAAIALRRFGLVCIQCGEPYWGTLGELAADRGVTDLEPVFRTLRGLVAQED